MKGEHLSDVSSAGLDGAGYMLSAEEVVRGLYSGLLNRPADPSGLRAFVALLARSENPAEALGPIVRRFLASEEYRQVVQKSSAPPKPVVREIPTRQIDPVVYRVPNELTVTPLPIRRVLVVGSCLSQVWAHRMGAMTPPCESDVYLLGTPVPDEPARPIGDYDFQIVQLALRFICPDASFVRLSQTDRSGHEALFAHAVAVLRQHLAFAMRWNVTSGLCTFVFPFLPPQQNLVGRLMPRYDIRNPVHFVEKLNEALVQELQAYANTFLFDLNEIVATHGRRFFQEDVQAQFNHGGMISDFDSTYDHNRLEPAGKSKDFYEEKLDVIFRASWHELVGYFRTIRQVDPVKMVVIDLDDTLWRGVVAELDPDALLTAEGWPRGLWEALSILKRRGIILAIVSKNDESRVVQLWDRILGKQLRLEDFSIRRINWRPKTENMMDILAQVNLLAESVVYVDDNPTERAAIAAAFPTLRVIGGTPLTWRRLLLWSSETQVAAISEESAVRTEMVRAQVEREQQRASLSRDEFLATLDVRIALFKIDGLSHPRFGRALELLNKTNQFNTTGRRWTSEDCRSAFEDETRFHAFEVSDRFTDYGLVGLLIVREARIEQFVMSCRVLGLGVEAAALAHILEMLCAAGAASVFAAMVETERNLPCRDVYRSCGFAPAEGGWRRPNKPPLPRPAHVTLSVS